jgi:hypothetical protein
MTRKLIPYAGKDRTIRDIHAGFNYKKPRQRIKRKRRIALPVDSSDDDYRNDHDDNPDNHDGFGARR